ncbi:Bug family tripartite tricarboxylate transporter substrate binding protein [Pseudonocardia sp. H11422]|uniref:Bug family tripartite tricarboxylate transporter substrate binding protein n=1 Tax=Pseudonocardia sp. H11422 TaxID=2835866 RepID=UPI001BDC963F|nr:tripartite tricarboxylate transporter substrate-binding protein [Pseudonocardia sp. H11422]
MTSVRLRHEPPYAQPIGDHRRTAVRLSTRRATTMLLGCLLLVAGCSPSEWGADGPRLRIMVPNVAGGGYDATARTAAAIVQRAGVVDDRIAVFNLDGDGGTVALRRLIAERGNGDLAMVMGLGVVGATVTVHGSGQVTEATPIARLIEEPEAVLVPARSRYHSIGELITVWRADPARLSIGGGSAAGGPDHLMSMRLAQAAGIDPVRVRYLPFDGGGDLLPALLDERIEVAVSSVVEYSAQIRSGQLRVLAVSGPARLPGVDAPTLTEAGFDLVFTNWRGVLAPPGISDSDRDRLVRLLNRLHHTPEWNAAVARIGWTNAFLPGEEFGVFLADQERDVREMLTKLGLA